VIVLERLVGLRLMLTAVPMLDLVGVLVVVVVVVVGVVSVDTVGVVTVLVGTQEAVTLLTGPTPAGTSCDAGVPAGALTVKVIVWPVTSITVTVHWSSAAALGIAAIAIAASTEAIVRTAIFSFPFLDTLVYLLPPRPLRAWSAPRVRSGASRKLTIGFELCNEEPTREAGSNRHPCLGRGERR
jgi:hypothetical protein